MANETTSKSALDTIEQLAKIGGLVAVPVLVALFGYLVQRQLASDNLSRDYVQMAVGILKEQKRPGDEQLRSWAIDLLNANSPNVKLNASVSEQLRDGQVRIPISVYNYTSPRVSSYEYTLPRSPSEGGVPASAPQR